MDIETTLLQCAFFGADILLFASFYKLYRYQLECLKSLQEAKCFEINNELPKKVNSAGGIIPYAVITGNVKALTVPLQSHHINSLKGVIYERIVTEKKVKWSPFLQIWDPTASAIKRNITNIPFGLCGGGFFKKQIVEVVDPLKAEELVLSNVYDHYIPHKENLTDFCVGVFKGEHTVATLDVENMLLEDTTLTAVGRLIIDNDKLKITLPTNRLPYYLTTASIDSLIEKVKQTASVTKALTIIMGTGALLFIVYFSKKAFNELKKRIDHARNVKRWEEARISRIKSDTSRGSAANGPKCIVCWENPVEVLILECGHVCLCINCSERCGNMCPYCRSTIDRFVPAFLP